MSDTDQLSLDALMELATPLLREAFDDMPPEQAAVTALGRRIRAEVKRIYSAGQSQALRAAHAKAVEVISDYPVPTFCATAIETRLHDWMHDRIEGQL